LGKGQPDPNMNPKLLQALRLYYPNFGGNSDIVALAPFGATTIHHQS
jgi:hypothetical protein